jgi:hypothetical protein
MPISQIRRFYLLEDFTSIGVHTLDVDSLRTKLATLSLVTPIADVQAVEPPGDGVVVEWASLPNTAGDFAAVDAEIAAFTGEPVSSAPQVVDSFAVQTSTSSTPVTKVSFTTPPLAGGSYLVTWVSSLRMQAVIANTGVEGKMRVTRSDGVFVEQPDAWDRANGHAFNGASPIEILAGQTLTALLTFSRLGASGTAEMSGARVSVFKVR